jgi:hypothetical protein
MQALPGAAATAEHPQNHWKVLTEAEVVEAEAELRALCSLIRPCHFQR